MTACIARRRFLRRFVAAGTGSWILVKPTSLRRSRANQVGSYDKLNVACIGAAGRGSVHVAAAAGRENLVALCDVDQKRAAMTFQSHPKARTFGDFRRMLDAMHKSIDAVVVATPDHTHAVAAMAAMQLGKHVYVEKPLTHTIHEARALTEAADRYGVVTQMGNQGHANRNARRGVEIIRDGAIGHVHQVHGWTDRPHWPQGLTRPVEQMSIPKGLNWDLWLGPAPERLYNGAYAPFQWRGWWDFGAGALGDMACHVMDLAFWSLNLGAPEWVEPVSVSAPPDIHPESAPKWSVVRWRFPSRGELPPVELTWYDGGKKPDPSLVSARALPDNGSILVGDKGVLYVPHTYCDKIILLPKQDFADYRGPKRTIPRASSHHNEFFDACKGRGKTQSHFGYAGPMTEAILLGTIALRTGERIYWDSESMRVTNSSKANDYIHYEYRKGWTL